MMTLKTLTRAALVGGALMSVTAPIPVQAQNDPTAGRIEQRNEAANRAKYFECAEFALTVYRAALQQAGADTGKVRAARVHYQSNLGRCQALL